MTQIILNYVTTLFLVFINYFKIIDLNIFFQKYLSVFLKRNMYKIGLSNLSPRQISIKAYNDVIISK